jgi:hypothetical protein
MIASIVDPLKNKAFIRNMTAIKILPPKPVAFKRNHLYKSKQHIVARNTNEIVSADDIPGATEEKKRVRFANLASVIRRPVTNEEIESSWYGNEEYSSFKEEMRNTIMAFKEFVKAKKQGVENIAARYNLDHHQLTVRGLEQYLASREGIKDRRFKTKQHIHVVLLEQHLQRCEGLKQFRK